LQSDLDNRIPDPGVSISDQKFFLQTDRNTRMEWAIMRSLCSVARRRTLDATALRQCLRANRFRASDARCRAGRTYVHLERVSEVVGLRKKLYRRPAQLCRVQDRRVALVRAPVSEKLFCLRGESLSKLGAQLRHDNINVGLLQTQSRIPFNNVTSDLISETSAGAYFKNTLYWNTWASTR
jgi:hypothetical protein